MVMYAWAQDDIILRQNFGVVIYENNDIVPPTGTFSLTVVIPFNITIPNGRIFKSNTYAPLPSLLDKAILSTVHKTQFLREQISLEFSHHSRQRRAAMQIVGSALRALFGLATEDQLTDVYAKLGIIESQVESSRMYLIDRDELILQIVESHNALVSILAVHTRQAEDIFVSVRDSLTNVSYALQELYTRTQSVLTETTLLTDLLALQTQFEYLKRVYSGLKAASRGYLNRDLIPDHEFQPILNNLRKTLAEQNLRLPTQGSDYFYSRTIVSDMNLRGKVIEIVLDLPVTENTIYQSFTFLTFPIPIHPFNPQKKGYTIAKGLPDVLIYNVTHYAIFNGKLKPGPMALHSAEFKTCAIAMLLNNLTLIHGLCNFQIYIDKWVPSLHVALSDSLHLFMLASYNGRGRLQCNHSSFAIKLPTFALVTVPCGCALHTSIFHLERKITLCQHKNKTVKIESGINLPVADAFKIKIPHSDGATRHTDNFEINMPDPSLIFSKLDESMRSQMHQGLDLRETAKRILKGDKKSPGPNINHTLTIFHAFKYYAPSVLSLFFSMLSLYFIYTLHSRLTRWINFVALSVNLPTTRAFAINLTHHILPDIKIKDLRHEDKEPTITPFTATTVPVGLIVLCTLLALFLLYKCVRKLHHHVIPMDSRGNWAYLTFTTGGSCYEFPLRPINHTVDSIEVVQTPVIQSMAIRLDCRERRYIMAISWSGQFKYKIKTTVYKDTFPVYLPIKSGYAGPLRSALNAGTYKVSLVARDPYGNALQMDVDTRNHESDIQGTSSGDAEFSYWCVCFPC